MSYTYLQDAGEESWAECCSDTLPFAPLKLNLTAVESCSNASETESCRDSQSGTMSRPLTASRGADLLTSFAADSPVKTSALPEKEKESPELKADCGNNLPASFTTWDRDTSLWRTHQCSLAGGWEPFSETWPRWGMMRNGECSELLTPSGIKELRAWITSAIESGSLQRMETPTTQDYCDRQPSWNVVMTKTGRARHLNSAGVQSQERLSQQIKRVPTPLASNSHGAGLHGDGGMNLQTFVMLSASELAPTPTAQDAKNNGSASQINRDALSATVGGPLNPEWVEWLMGWPIGWTDLQPLATDKFRLWLRSHGER